MLACQWPDAECRVPCQVALSVSDPHTALAEAVGPLCGGACRACLAVENIQPVGLFAVSMAWFSERSSDSKSPHRRRQFQNSTGNRPTSFFALSTFGRKYFDWISLSRRHLGDRLFIRLDFVAHPFSPAFDSILTTNTLCSLSTALRSLDVLDDATCERSSTKY